MGSEETVSERTDKCTDIDNPEDDSADKRALCPICPHACRLKPGQIGICGARHAVGDSVVPANYGQITAVALDPIEKKPLAHYLPGSMILSVGSYGCNLSCPFCQNSTIARARFNHLDVSVESISPLKLVELARNQRANGNIGLAYTYNEPLVGLEFVIECSKLIHEAKMKNILVSNGYINAEPFAELLPWLDAANIDLKAFNQDFYDWVGAPQGLETVKRTIIAAAASIHVEVTTLIIPGRNDFPDQLNDMARWLADVDPDITLHLTRFFPTYKMMDASPTPVGTLRELAAVARQHLRYVEIGNI